MDRPIQVQLDPVEAIEACRAMEHLVRNRNYYVISDAEAASLVNVARLIRVAVRDNIPT